jgi:hypothetical protein
MSVAMNSRRTDRLNAVAEGLPFSSAIVPKVSDTTKMPKAKAIIHHERAKPAPRCRHQNHRTRPRVKSDRMKLSSPTTESLVMRAPGGRGL